MKKRLLFLAMVFCFIFSKGVSESLPYAISPQDLSELVDHSMYLNLFDLRSGDDFDAGHIPLASSFPLKELKTMIRVALDSGYTSMTSPIIVYGESLQESLDAIDILQEFGFTNLSYLESISLWQGTLISMDEETQVMGHFHTNDIQGNEQDGSILTGYQVTVVNVWATYSSACAHELEELGKLKSYARDRGVQIVGLLSDAVGVSMEPDQDILENARQIVDETGADFVHLVPSKELYRKIVGQVTVVPTTFIVDETGAVIQIVVGPQSYDQWKALIDNAIDETYGIY